MTEDSRIQLHVWSDYVCPFCYLELPELERLASEMGDDFELSVTDVGPREPRTALDP